MIVPESLRLNKFRLVKIPTSKEIYDRFGKCKQVAYSGDQVANFDNGKISQMEVVSEINQGKILDEEDLPK